MHKSIEITSGRKYRREDLHFAPSFLILSLIGCGKQITNTDENAASPESGLYRPGFHAIGSNMLYQICYAIE